MKRARSDSSSSSENEGLPQAPQAPPDVFAFTNLLPELQQVISDPSHMGPLERGALAVTSRGMHAGLPRHILPHDAAALEQLRLGWCRAGDHERYTLYTRPAFRTPAHGVAMLEHGHTGMFLATMDLDSSDTFYASLWELLLRRNPRCSVALVRRIFCAFTTRAIVEAFTGEEILLHMCDQHFEQYWDIFFKPRDDGGGDGDREGALQGLLLEQMGAGVVRFRARSILQTPHFFQYLLTVLPGEECRSLCNQAMFVDAALSGCKAVVRLMLPHTEFTIKHFCHAVDIENYSVARVVCPPERRPFYLRQCLRLACEQELRRHRMTAAGSPPWQISVACDRTYMHAASCLLGWIRARTDAAANVPTVDEVVAAFLYTTDYSPSTPELQMIGEFVSRVLAENSSDNDDDDRD